jgi:hypothetical protein
MNIKKLSQYFLTLVFTHKTPEMKDKEQIKALKVAFLTTELDLTTQPKVLAYLQYV